jgi:hypothetical protein
MASYNSEFIMETDLTEQQLIENWADCIYHNHHARRVNESFFDIVIQENGYIVFDNRSCGSEYGGAATYDNGVYLYREFEDEDWELREPESNRVILMMNNLLEQAKALAFKKIENDKNKKAAEERAKNETRLADDRRQLEYLKKKLGES